MVQNLQLTQDGDGLYGLTGVTSDPFELLRDRFTTLFLSQVRGDGRGSTFARLLARGEVRTNSNVLSLFAATAASVIRQMFRFSEEYVLTSASLRDFEFVSDTQVNLTVQVNGRAGSFAFDIGVSA